MNYDNDWVKARYDKGEEIEFVFFWAHHSRSKESIDKSCLSQWFERDFQYKNVKYLTAEHWMMAEKAKLFKDDNSLKLILNSKTAKDAKALGRKVRGFDIPTWTSCCESIMKNGIYLKFKQNKDLREYLNSTGNKILVEASPYDNIWGIGMKNGDNGIENPNNWKGLNLLGYALMEVRDKLRNE